MRPLPSYPTNFLFETSFKVHVGLPGFFPGAGGFFHGHVPNTKRFMFFGTDFGTLRYQQGLEQSGGEPKSNATIRYLRSIVERVPLPLGDCFLTNAVLCMRRGDSATEAFPIWKQFPDYVAMCAEWHSNFIADNQPKVIVLMGKPHLVTFGPMLFPELAAHWRGFRAIADVFNASRETLRLPDGTLVLLMHHPSHWPAYPACFKERIAEHLAEAASR